MQIQELFERQSWRLARSMLSRLHRDSRARDYVGSMAGLILLLALVPISLAGAVAVLVVAPAQAGVFGSLLGLLIAFGLGFARSVSRRQAALDRAAEQVPISVRSCVTRTAYWLTLLLRRCGSEVALLNEIPPEIEIVTRRVLLDSLKHRGIWEEMPLSVRELFLKPDGTWAKQERDAVADKFEVLHCLRWVAGQDEPLQMLALAPRYAYPRNEDTLPDAEWLREQKIVSPITLAERQKIAARLYDRCFVELVRRGLITVQEQHKQKLAEMQTAIQEGNDWMYGRHSIGELDVTELQRHSRRVLLRHHTLKSVLDAISSQSADAVASLMERAFPAEVQAK